MIKKGTGVFAKHFLEKDLFTEGRATVCYSNNVAGCKSFFGSPTWSVVERDRTALTGIRLAETLWACCRYCTGGRVKGSFCEVEEREKNSDTFFR